MAVEPSPDSRCHEFITPAVIDEASAAATMART
jgi:hypothetical protein